MGRKYNAQKKRITTIAILFLNVKLYITSNHSTAIRRSFLLTFAVNLYVNVYIHFLFSLMRELDSNQRPSGYEPDEIPTSPPRYMSLNSIKKSNLVNCCYIKSIE
jgi:hypothetical protein